MIIISCDFWKWYRFSSTMAPEIGVNTRIHSNRDAHWLSLSLSLSCTSVSFTSKGMPEECFLLPFLFFFFFFFSSFFVVIAPINIPYFFLLCSGNEAPPLPTAVPPPLLEYLPVLLAPLPPLALLTSQVLFPSPLQSVVQRGTPPWG